MGTLPPQVANALGAVPVNESAKFQIENLSEGRYRMNVQTPPGAYIASIQQAAPTFSMMDSTSMRRTRSSDPRRNQFGG
jgi:hypothetical protein